MKLCQNVKYHKFKSSSKLDHVGSKSRSLGQIIKKLCVHSKGHRFGQKFMKLYQNVNSYKSKAHLDALKHRTCGSADSSISQFLQIMTLHCSFHFLCKRQ